MNWVNKGINKKDSMALVTGKPVYTDDITPDNCLIVKVLRSPHAHALIKDIDVSAAINLPGIEGVFTYKDVPKSRFTTAGQSFPEPSPYDRLILDQRLRYVGDAVAIVAGYDESSVDKALKAIKVEYEVLDFILDLREAKDNPILVHPEEDFKTLMDVGADNKRNICASGGFTHGDVEKEFEQCDFVVEETYHTKANHQVAMETFRTYTEIDTYGRLNVISSTQVPFHARRILANALDIPKSKVRVIKPRIGGGFGAKQSVVSELYPAFVTWKTGKAAKMIYSRQESLVAGSPRHEMEVKVKVGCDKEGIIKAISMYTLSNAGAYGVHGPTTVELSGHKPLPIYNTAKAYKFEYDVVYTNTMPGGAYRGYGATQGCFAMESAINQLAVKLNMDPTELRAKNLLKEGQIMPAYYNETATSCTLDRCLEKAKEMIEWDKKYPYVDLGNNKVRSVGLALSMQGSGISQVDVATVEIKLNDDGFYTLMHGAADMGTGCDTILAQIAAETLECDVEDIVVQGVDTDQSPYDTGSYASSTTYVTGMATVKTCESLREKIKAEGARLLDCSIEEVEFDGKRVYIQDAANQAGRLATEITLKDLANFSLLGQNKILSASESHSSDISPPPYMAGAVEIELDLLTGKLDLIDFVGVVDCGTTINPKLARIQAEGGIVQGIGMALYEDITYNQRGRMLNDSLMQYKIPTRLDMGNIRVEFESSYEESGPYGAKSIGEVVINTPCPAIAHAVYNATGVHIRTLPITSEKIAMGMMNLKKTSG
ncbi:MAG: xanthine dehydrogenase family protein molybdopterin-binding subunit [Anaerovoracaceae bacterium]|jgi:putative selenate reductase molybdopterin-binding subunit